MVAAPPSLSGTMVAGQQTLVSFSLANLGGAPSGSIQLLLPANAPWLSAVTAQPMASLAPGQTNLVTLALTPSNGLALGAYSGGWSLPGRTSSFPCPSLSIAFPRKWAICR